MDTPSSSVSPEEVLIKEITTNDQHRSLLSKIVGFLPRLLLKTLRFTTLSLPVYCYRLLTCSFTLHLNFSSLLVILSIVILVTYLIVRYRFLTKYSRLKPIESSKMNSFDLHPTDSKEEEEEKTEFLSAFLSSIKIFGYLEEPVFHELARHLQTKKLLAGDTLFRNASIEDEEKSFYIVVNGHVQMYIKPENSDEYTIMNEIGPGGTLSSLFTILSIFKESYKSSSVKSSFATDHTEQVFPNLAHDPIDFGDDLLKSEYRSVHPNIMVRATVDTTLAVIPQKAFHILTSKFPKAAAHIVQVIITRFQRVTLMTSHRYLGLTDELLRLERWIHVSASISELPAQFFPPGGVERLRRNKLAHMKEDENEYSVEDDEHLRSSVMGCIADVLGIKQNSQPGFSSPPQTTMHSSTHVFDSTEYMDDETSSLGSESINECISPDDIQILYFPKDEVVIQEGVHTDGLFFVMDGLLEVLITQQQLQPMMTTPETVQGEEEEEDTFTFSKQDKVRASKAPAGHFMEHQQPIKQSKPIFVIQPGGVAGYLDALTGYPSFVEVKAKIGTFVGFVSKKNLSRIVDRNPSVMFKLANELVRYISPLVLHIDIALEWMQIGAGHIIYKQGEPSESIYMVLHGRLRTIQEKKGGEIVILDEFGHGDSVGDLELLTGEPTSSTLHAIRDTEIARIPKTLFNALSFRHPKITLQVTRMIALRSLHLLSNKKREVPNNKLLPELYGRNNVNLKTIGIIPVNATVPITEFAEHLKYELMHSVDATCTLLNSATVTSNMGKHAFSRLGKLRLASWLAEQEEKYRIVLYLADSSSHSWMRTCIRQADCILLVGLGNNDPSVGEYEHFLINMKTTARKELVLLHPERSCPSGATQNWLKNRLWIQAHHHIYMPMRNNNVKPWIAESLFHNVKDQIKEYYGLKRKIISPNNDFARLARRLCGKSVALVLGGGGAKGIGHIGIIQAIEEAGIPIDIIGGTSIGSFVGSLYARNVDLVSVIARTKLFAGRMSSVWRQLMDLTYPLTAWFTGHEFNRSIWKCLGDSQIEDYWLPYYAVTTNITFSRMEVHTKGYGWRYVRASMSLSGYLPPICDNGNMLVDGGYMDNLPVSVAKNMGADIIIAVDVATDDDTSPVHYGDSISGWWALLHGFNPFRTYNVPSIADIQGRLAYVSSVSKLEEAKMIDGTLYIKLPVQEWGTLDFQKFNDIFQRGYQVGKEVVGHWRKAGYVSGRLHTNLSGSSGKEVKGKSGRRNSI
ncbi:patatin-domain-containing protein [Backusella circina FSU 941]|nr:patatin-domain-containing protein [Backusella circina FSU 941]